MNPIDQFLVERAYERAAGEREIDPDVPLSADWRTVYRAMAVTLDEDDVEIEVD